MFDDEFDDGASTPRINEVYTVSRLNSEARWLLEENFGQVWIEGEISNLARPRSGHIYFTLKDDGAQVRAAMFRAQNRRLDFAPDNGTQVLVRGRVSLYRERGDFQLIADHMELAGAGALRRQFEELRRRLDEQGLFDTSTKLALPAFPSRIGIVTSPTGAAVRDALQVLHSRFPGLGVIIYPTRVQGEGAGQEIAKAIALADARQECDVLLLVRGGGSLEDLWAFNEEVTARAIHACSLPIVSGVGHETDVTIADFVADVRAPTPSVAAEMASPHRAELQALTDGLQARLHNRTRALLNGHDRTLALTAKRLRHPRHYLERLAQRTDDSFARLERALTHVLPRHHAALVRLSARLDRAGPAAAISQFKHRNERARDRMSTSIRETLGTAKGAVDTIARELYAVSPQRTLDRGYAVVSDEAGEILRAASRASVGQRIEARLANGRLICTVEEIIDPT